jgi:hypothetical protein
MNERRVKRIDELARDIPPARDLWPAIAAAIEEDRRQAAAPAEVTPRRSAWRYASSMAAAVALVAVGIWIGARIVPPGGGPIAGNGSVSASGAVPVALQRDAEYRETRAQLVSEVEARLATMPQAEREKVGASLATLRRSISEIEAALGRDPANALLQELLVSSCQEEMRALTVVRDSGNQEI